MALVVDLDQVLQCFYRVRSHKDRSGNWGDLKCILTSHAVVCDVRAWTLRRADFLLQCVDITSYITGSVADYFKFVSLIRARWTGL